MKKKGFTLIELLAVIVVLAVIALITVPMIRNVIEDTRKGAFKDSVMSAFHEVEYYLLENNFSEIQEGGIEVTSLKLDNNEFEYGIIIQNEEGELEAINVSDGKYCASGAMTALEVHKGECDAEAPKVEVSVEGKVATISLSDNIGVIAYAVTKKDEEVTDWTEIEETESITETYEATEAGEYTAWVKDKYGKVSSQNFTINQSAFCAYTAGKSWDFTYKGNVDTWTVPCDGTYKLEVWGAQGGPKDGTASSKGGYSYGQILLNKDQKLYVVVGGQGKNGVHSETSTPAGGYNGGGAGKSQHILQANSYISGSGGGATHIATTNYGELKNYSSHQNDVLIVAGGSGGTGGRYGWDNDGSSVTTNRVGGTGGGTTGGNGMGSTGGTQTSAGSNPTYCISGAGFGYGGSPGGGGGWYGGGCVYFDGGPSGGSGHLNTAQLIPNTTGMSNGVQSGNGQAKITLVSLSN